MNLILIQPNEASQGFLTRSDYRSQHILTILKLKKDDQCHMGIANHSKGLATISAITSDKLYFTYTEQEPADTPYPLSLIIPACRPLVMKRLLRDMTAIGYKNIVIYVPENGERGYMQSSLWRDNNYLRAIYDGLMLARSVTVPNIIKCNLLREALNNIKPTNLIVMDANGTEFYEQIEPWQDNTALVLGNERGFTTHELITLKYFNAKIFHMGNRIIRMETACAMASGILISRYGHLS